MSKVSEVINRSRAIASRQGWSKSRLALESGLSKNALRNLDDEDASFKSDTLEKLEAFITSLSKTRRRSKQ